MFNLIMLLVFGWLSFVVLKLTFKVAWGVAKVVAIVLFILALPLLVVGLLFAGGVSLLPALLPILIALGILKLCT